MKIHPTKEWCERSAEIEGEANVGAGALGPVEVASATTSPSSVEDAVVDLIRSRGKVGRGKYKQTMDRKDLRPEAWMQHLQEELGDALQYAERVKNCGKLLDDARSIMLTLLHERDWECAAEWVARHDAQFFPVNES